MKQEGELEINASTSDKEGPWYAIWDEACMVYRYIYSIYSIYIY